MKRKTRYPITLLCSLACCLGVGATCTLLLAQEEAPSSTKPGLSLAVLVDSSAHQKHVIKFEREAVSSIANGFASVATDAIVVRYGDEVELLQDRSPIEGLKAVSPRIELDAENGQHQRTLLYEALDTALLKLDTASSANSKVVIIIGEGNNSGGRIKYSDIKKRAKSVHVQCFVLLVADHNLMGGRVRQYGFDLYDLASATKGKAYDIERNRTNLDKAIHDILKRVQ